MKKILLFFALLLALPVCAQQIELHDFKENSQSLVPQFLKNWQKDMNGEHDCALVCIRVENMLLADADKATFNFGNLAPIVDVLQNKERENLNEIWLFVTPTSKAIMEVTLGRYGASNRLHDLNLKPKHVYEVVMTNKKTMSINVITQPAGMLAKLETGQSATTPGTITDVPLGKHKLTLSHNGMTKATKDIEVTEENVRFEYDLRPRKLVKFTSDPSKAILFVNDKEMGKTPCELELPYDNYKVQAYLNDEQHDTQTITVDNTSDPNVKLSPIRKKTFEVYAMYNGSKVDADLFVNEEIYGTKQPSYQLNLPINETYRLRMAYLGNSKEKKIRVKKNMPTEYEFKISGRKTITWPWQREYDAAPVGLTVAWVGKTLVTEGYGEKWKENGFLNSSKEKGKMLHGIQAGIQVQPAFSFGLGLHTGLFYEYYYAPVKDEDTYVSNYDRFQEHCIYLPLHGYFRLPFNETCCVYIHGGLGLNYAVYGKFSDKDDDYEDLDDNIYGEDAYPKRFNLTGEIGGGIRLNKLQINMLYSRGLNDHGSYKYKGSEYKTVQNKITVGVAWVFGSE